MKFDISIELKKIIARNSNYTTWTVSTPHLDLLVKEVAKQCADIADTADAFRDDFDDGDIETCIARTLNEIFEMGRDHYDGIGA